MNVNGIQQALAAKAYAEPKIAQLKKAAAGTEAMFVKSLLAEMEKGTKTFGEGPGSDIYSDMFNDAIAQSISSRGAFGIGNLMIKQGTQRIMAEANAFAQRSARANDSK